MSRHGRKPPRDRDGSGRTDAPATGLGTLAERLGRRDLPRPDHAKAPVAAPVPPVRPVTPPDDAVTPTAMSPEEAMAAAVRAMGRDFSYSAKYMGEGWRPTTDVGIRDPAPTDAPDASDAPGGSAPRTNRRDAPIPRRADLTDDDLLFFETMSPGTRPLHLDDDAPDPDDGPRPVWADAAQLDRLRDDELHPDGLAPGQRDILRRSRRGPPLPVLPLDDGARAPAIGRVDAFVRDAIARGVRHVRIIVDAGRTPGLPSELRARVAAWCDRDGADLVLRWAPDRDRTGRVDSMVLELRRG